MGETVLKSVRNVTGHIKFLRSSKIYGLPQSNQLMEKGRQSITLGDDRLCLSGEQLSESRYCTFMGEYLERLVF